MKKLFPDEKGEKKKFAEFLDKKGFYIVLLLCIAIVAGTAIYVTTRGATSNDPNYDAQNIIPDDLDNDSAADVGGSLNAQASTSTGKSAADKKTGANNSSNVAQKDGDKSAVAQNTNKTASKGASSTTYNNTSKKSNTSAKKQSFVMPVNGSISFEYAKDKLVYSKTLEEWRAHEGVDLAAERGTPVKAVADGVISEIKNDPRYGVIVIIDHKNGLKSVYSNLASDDMVTTNQKVKQGEVIGSVGNTAAFESSEQPHLHFEVLKDNVAIDPNSYLPKNLAKKD